MNHTRISCKRLIAVLLCLAALLALTACGAVKMEQKQIFAMDTVMTLTAYGKNASAALDAGASVIYSMQAELDPLFRPAQPMPSTMRKAKTWWSAHRLPRC